MSQTKKHTKDEPIKKETEPKLFVSDSGQYLFDDAAGRMFKEWHELIKKATRLPTKPSIPK